MEGEQNAQNEILAIVDELCARTLAEVGKRDEKADDEGTLPPPQTPQPTEDAPADTAPAPAESAEGATKTVLATREKPEAVLLDLTNMFKHHGTPSPAPATLADAKAKTAPPAGAAAVEEAKPEPEKAVQKNEIPRNLTITQDDMKQRRWMDQRRWFCLSRPQYQRSCGISSLISCWNYLFSTLGVGQLPPISQEEAIDKLGLVKEADKLYADVDYGQFTGNQTLIRWWKILCHMYKQEGRSYMLWKASGEGKTDNIDREYALEKLLEGLRSENTCFIYHAYDHYFCPIGYDLTPNRPQDAFKKLSELGPNDYEPWIFIAETAKFYPPMHIKKWKDIAMDIELENPKYYNIREPQKGVMERTNGVIGGTLNCIMAFQKVVKIPKKVREKPVTAKAVAVRKYPTAQASAQGQENAENTPIESVPPAQDAQAQDAIQSEPPVQEGADALPQAEVQQAAEPETAATTATNADEGAASAESGAQAAEVAPASE